jgi:uncharacterized membrane protein
MLQVAYNPIFGSYPLVIICAAGICAVMWWSRPKSDQLPHYGQRVLLTLRILALLLLLFAMLRPTLVYTESKQLSAVVNVLLDQTESMTQKDMIGGKSRFAAAKDALQNAAPQLRRLQRQADVRAFAFDTALNPLGLHEGTFTDLPNEPKGKETPLGFILDRIREDSAGKRVLAIIILTDGAQRTRPSRDVLPQDAAARLHGAGMPLYAIPLGQAGLDGNVRDISVESVQANDRVFVKNNMLITGTLRITGFNDQPIPVHLLFETADGKIEKVADTIVQAREDGQYVPFRLSHAPQTVGLFKYTVKVPPQEREVTHTNNEQSGFVQVLEGGLRVLYIQGQRNFEQGPLRQSINASPDINLQYVRVEKPGNLADAFRESPIPHNVYILDDIDSTKFTPQELRTLVTNVANGSGLIMLGGLNAFSGGSYYGTPIADVSPVVIPRAEPQASNAPARADIHWSATRPIPMLLTELGAQRYVMQFESDPQMNARRWAALPPLLGANRFDRLKAGAEVLAVGPSREILLVAHRFYSGRVLAFAGDSTYRWRLAGKEEEHKMFWRQVVLWLAKMEDGGSGACWVAVENTRLFPGDTAKFQVFMRSEEGELIKDFTATARVLKADNNIETVALVPDDGTPTGSFRSTDFSGDYKIMVEATTPTGETKSAEARFLVQAKDMELDNPIAYPKLLEDISALTGGRHEQPEKLGALIEELIQQSNALVEKRETKRTLFDTWYLLLSFVLLLATEWGLRKYWGMA